MYKPFCYKLINTLVETGISQRQVALKTGIDVCTMNKYTNGLSEPKLTQFVAICKCLNVSPNELLGWESKR